MFLKPLGEEECGWLNWMVEISVRPYLVIIKIHSNCDTNKKLIIVIFISNFLLVDFSHKCIECITKTRLGRWTLKYECMKVNNNATYN